MSAATLRVPRVNANDDTVEVLVWHVENGDFVEKGQEVVDLGTSKATIAIAAESSGYVRIHAQAGEFPPVGATLASFHATKEEAEAATKEGSPQSALSSGNKTSACSAAAPSAGAYPFTRLSAAAKRYCEEHGIDPSQLKGLGLLTARALEAFERNEPVVASSLGKAREATPSLRPAGALASKRSVRVGKAKMAEIESLTLGQSGNVVSSLTVQLNSAGIVRSLREYKAFNGSLLPLLLYELAKIHASEPKLTAYYEAGQIHYYDRMNLGVAIDLGTGLKVTVIRDANLLMPIDIYKHLIDFSLRYASNQVTLDDLSDGTLTVTDLSGQNIIHFQPLLNQFQSAILGVGGDSTLEGRPLTLTMAFDHRVLTGREVAGVLEKLKRQLLSYDFEKLNGAPPKSLSETLP